MSFSATIFLGFNCLPVISADIREANFEKIAIKLEEFSGEKDSGHPRVKVKIAGSPIDSSMIDKIYSVDIQSSMEALAAIFRDKSKLTRINRVVNVMAAWKRLGYKLQNPSALEPCGLIFNVIGPSKGAVQNWIWHYTALQKADPSSLRAIAKSFTGKDSV